MRTVPALWLDIDGTVRKSVDDLGRFVNCAADVEVYPEALEQIRKYKASGYRIFGISNQGGISLGLVSMENVAAAMMETQRQCEGMFDRIGFCQHHPAAKDPEYAVCWCRKPRIGLIVEVGLAASAMFNNECYPPHLGLFIGDMEEDRQCAENAALQFMRAEDWRAGAHTTAPTGAKGGG